MLPGRGESTEKLQKKEDNRGARPSASVQAEVLKPPCPNPAAVRRIVGGGAAKDLFG
jgi:hypothetical protein